MPHTDDDLFPPDFIARVRRELPEAERMLALAQRRIVVAKSAGADVSEQEKEVFKLQGQISKMKAAFRI